MKCAIYARVSTDEQGTSIINQQEYFKDYIQKNNYEIFDIYSDEAFSGTEMTKRLSFQRLLEDGKNRKYDVLLAKSYSRFGRNQRETLMALTELFERGVRIIFVEDGLDSLNDKGQFGLFAWLAEQEARKISERIKLTWQLYNKEGKIHTTNSPHGYTYDSNIKNFIINEKEAEIVQLIFSRYLQGEGIRKIMNFLNTNGYKTKNGCNWSIFLIRNILTNEFYIGNLVQGKRRTIDVTIKKFETLDKKEWIIHKNHHEAIISEYNFYKVQEQFTIRSNYVKNSRQSRHSNLHLFSNIVKCKICGATFIFKRKKVENYIERYTCGTYENKGAACCGHKRNSITEKTLISLIKTDLQQLSEEDFNRIKDYYKFKRQLVKNNNSSLTIQLRKLKKKIEEKTKISLSLLEAYSKGIFGDKQYKLQNKLIEQELNNLIEQKESLISEIKKQSAEIDNEKETIEIMKNLLKMTPKMWTNEMMKKVIKYIDVNMTSKEVNIFFNFNLPL